MLMMQIHAIKACVGCVFYRALVKINLDLGTCIIPGVKCIFNPRHMHEGYGSHFVCVCLSVTTLAAAYLIYTLKTKCC